MMPRNLSLVLLPRIALLQTVSILIATFLAVLLAYAATPRLSQIKNAPSLEQTIPHVFGDWVEIKSPLVQVSLTTGGETDINRPYDQVVMRSYQNKEGKIVQLALAWGANQRQEVKIHRPDLCYVAQGYRIQSLKTVHFDSIHDPRGKAVVGKRMYAENPQGGEAVSYWMRIGGLYSEDAWETRGYIFREGFKGHIPDGMLVRASSRVMNINDANQAWPLLENFLNALASATPDTSRDLLIK